jgi:hypothetical protein
MGVSSYRTYTFATPPRTHYRPASCEEYLCSNFLYGFETTLDLATDVGVDLAGLIRSDRTRSHIEIRTSLYEVRFQFPPGTKCWEWKSHKVPVDRPPILLVRGGDWRASTGLIRRHTRPEYWAEDFALHQDHLATAFNGTGEV